MTDDVTAPLGQSKKASRTHALTAFAPHVAAGALGVCLVSFALWAAAADDPLGGEPTVLVAVAPAGTPAKATEDSPVPVIIAAPSRYDGPAPGSKTITIIDGTSGKREEVTISAPSATQGSPRASAATAPVGDSANAPNTKLIETSRHGPIPKVGPDGAPTMSVLPRPRW